MANNRECNLPVMDLIPAQITSSITRVILEVIRTVGLGLGLRLDLLLPYQECG